MAPMVDTDLLIDAHTVAELVGLAHPNSVSLYQRRHDEMPRPVLDLGVGRPKLWLRPEIEDWVLHRRPVRVDRAMRARP